MELWFWKTFFHLSSVVTLFESISFNFCLPKLCCIREVHQQPEPHAIVRLRHPTASPCGRPAARRPSWLPPAHEAFEVGGALSVQYPSRQIRHSEWTERLKDGYFHDDMMVENDSDFVLMICNYMAWIKSHHTFMRLSQRAASFHLKLTKCNEPWHRHRSCFVVQTAAGN